MSDNEWDDCEWWVNLEPLHFAAQAGDLPSVIKLIKGGINVGTFDGLGYTPLHYAAMEEHLDVASYLLEHGADVNAHHEPSIGETPLGQVAGNCSWEMASLLVKAGADPTIRGWMWLTALHSAERRKRADGPRIYQLFKDAIHRRANPIPAAKGPGARRSKRRH